MGGGGGGRGGGGGGRESFCITPDNRNIQINVFPISPQKYMLWVLIRMGFTEATLMNIHNVYFHGKLSKIPKLMMKKSSGAVFIVCSQSLNTLTLNTYHAMGRFSRRQTGDTFPRNRI